MQTKKWTEKDSFAMLVVKCLKWGGRIGQWDVVAREKNED